MVLPKVHGPVRMADRVAELLSEEIRSGRLAVGDKLPTEVELVKQLGVSRTVVREAISQLRNAGQLDPRQGLGVFVTAPRMAPLDLSMEALETRAKVLQIVEVRRAIEAEAAALAASRVTPADVTRIREALVAIDTAAEEGRDGVDEDLAFHRAVAEATQNPVLVATVRYLGEVMRSGIRVTRANEARRDDFIQQVRREHHAIAEAIEAGDSAAAAAAARTHMKGAAERLQDAGATFWNDAVDLEVDLSEAP